MLCFRKNVKSALVLFLIVTNVTLISVLKKNRRWVCLKFVKLEYFYDIVWSGKVKLAIGSSVINEFLQLYESKNSVRITVRGPGAEIRVCN